MSQNQHMNQNKKKKEKKFRLKQEFINPTPEGLKKGMDFLAPSFQLYDALTQQVEMPTEMAEEYDPPAVEAAWYSWWEKQGFFKPEYKNYPVKSSSSLIAFFSTLSFL